MHKHSYTEMIMKRLNDGTASPSAQSVELRGVEFSIELRVADGWTMDGGG